MIFDEKDNLMKIYISAKRLRNVNGSESLMAMMDMNKSMTDICVSSIKNKKPKIKEKELIKKLKKIYQAK